MVNIEIDNSIYFKYDNETYKMDMYDFISFVKKNYNFYIILDIDKMYYVINRYNYNIKSFSNINQFNEIFNINDIVAYLMHNEWVNKYAKKVEE